MSSYTHKRLCYVSIHTYEKCCNPPYSPIMERLKIDSRVGLLGVLLVALIGTLLLSDWHGFGGNPCNPLSMNVSSVSQKSTSNDGLDKSHSFSAHDSIWSGSGSGLDRGHDGANTSENEDSLLVREFCESLSTSDHQCFWNPKSRVTGEHCTTCRSVCLSKQKSINFIQFSIGVALIAIMLQPGVVFYIVVASNITDKQFQVCLTCNYTAL